MMDTFNNHLHLPVTKIDDSQRTLARLKARAATRLACYTTPCSS